MTIIQIIILMCLYKNVILIKIIFMIQRIQSVYLLLIIVANLIYKLFINYSSDFVFPGYTLMANWISSIYIYLIPTIMISLVSLLLYKNQNIQLILNRVNLLFQLIFLASSFDNLMSFNTFYMILIFNIVFIYLANSGIKKDKKLIKSLDRIR